MNKLLATVITGLVIDENAKAYFKIKEKYGSFDKFLWSYTNNTPIKGKWENMQQIPTQTELSKKLSKELIKAKLALRHL